MVSIFEDDLEQGTDRLNDGYVCMGGFMGYLDVPNDRPIHEGIQPTIEGAYN